MGRADGRRRRYLKVFVIDWISEIRLHQSRRGIDQTPFFVQASSPVLAASAALSPCLDPPPRPTTVLHRTPPYRPLTALAKTPSTTLQSTSSSSAVAVRSA